MAIGLMWRRMGRHPGLMLGILIVTLFGMIALTAPWLAPSEDPKAPYVMTSDGFDLIPHPPGPDHPLGTLARQYDVFYGVVWGTRVAFVIGLSITAVRMLIGVALGLLAGFYGGWIDAFLMRLTDAAMALPLMAMAMVAYAIGGVPQLGMTDSMVSGSGIEWTLAYALMAFGWMRYARLIRGNVLREREMAYVDSAVAVGVRKRRILLRHLFPNAMQGLFVLAASDIGAMVVWMATFRFLGLKTSFVALANWGDMLNASRDWIIGMPSDAFAYWYTYLPPSLAIVLFSMGWSLIGDGLRDLLDPKYARANGFRQ